MYREYVIVTKYINVHCTIAFCAYTSVCIAIKWGFHMEAKSAKTFIDL